MDSEEYEYIIPEYVRAIDAKPLLIMRYEKSTWPWWKKWFYHWRYERLYKKYRKLQKDKGVSDWVNIDDMFKKKT